jgi:hypothetical protein
LCKFRRQRNEGLLIRLILLEVQILPREARSV